MDDASTHLALTPSLDECPVRLDVYLAGVLDDHSRSQIQKIIKQGSVQVNGREVKAGHLLQGGEEIRLAVIPADSALPAPEDIELDILYEDDDLLVVNKPAGLVVHPGAGMHSGTMVNALLHRYGSLQGVGDPARPGIVHRLDRLTTGCLCVARTAQAHRILSEQLADRTMGREYRAWVVGEMPEREGVIDAPVGRSPRNPTRMSVVRPGGREAVTHWSVELRAPGLTRITCRLETGRTHQIRVHLAHKGFPVVGDPEYGLTAKEAKMRIPPGYPLIVQALSRCTRQMLHASSLHLRHPRTGEAMEFHAPLPEDFQALDAVLEMYPLV